MQVFDFKYFEDFVFHSLSQSMCPHMAVLGGAKEACSCKLSLEQILDLEFGWIIEKTFIFFLFVNSKVSYVF